jgi:hypothetical protein
MSEYSYLPVSEGKQPVAGCEMLYLFCWLGQSFPGDGKNGIRLNRMIINNIPPAPYVPLGKLPQKKSKFAKCGELSWRRIIFFQN